MHNVIKSSLFSLPDFLNERQLEVISDALQRPSAYCIQGPPGTGKTAGNTSTHEVSLLIIIHQ